jgi:hypothetical protein
MNNYTVNHTYAAVAGATLVSWLPIADTALHILASLAVLVTVILTYLTRKKQASINPTKAFLKKGY